MATSFQQRPQNLFSGSSPGLKTHSSSGNVHRILSSPPTTSSTRPIASTSHLPTPSSTAASRAKVMGCAMATVYIKMKTQESIGLGSIVGRHLELRMDEKKRILKVRSHDRSKPDINIYKKDIHSVDKDEVEYGIIGMVTETYRVTLNLNNETNARKLVNWLSGRKVELERCKKCKDKKEQASPVKVARSKSVSEDMPRAAHSETASHAFEPKATTQTSHTTERNSDSTKVRQSTGNTPSKKNLFGSKSTGNILGSSKKSEPANAENITRNSWGSSPLNSKTTYQRANNTNPDKTHNAHISSPTNNENYQSLGVDKSPMRTDKSAKSGPKSRDSRLNADRPKKVRLSDISPVKPKAANTPMGRTKNKSDDSTRDTGAAEEEAPPRHELKKAEMAEKLRRRKEKATTSAPSVDPEAIRESRMKAEKEKQRAAEERTDTQQRAYANSATHPTSKNRAGKSAGACGAKSSTCEPTPTPAPTQGTNERVSPKKNSGHDSGFGFADAEDDSEAECWPFESSQSPRETPAASPNACEHEEAYDIVSHKKTHTKKKTSTRREKDSTQTKDSPMEGLFASTKNHSTRVSEDTKMHTSTPVDGAQTRKGQTYTDSPESIDLVSPIKPASRTKFQHARPPASTANQFKKQQHSKVPTPAPGSQDTEEKPTRKTDEAKTNAGTYGNNTSANAGKDGSPPDLLEREGVLSLDDTQIDSLGVKKLKQALDTLGVSWTGCVEKQHLRTLLRESIKNPPPSSTGASQENSSEPKTESPSSFQDSADSNARTQTQESAGGRGRAPPPGSAPNSMPGFTSSTAKPGPRAQPQASANNSSYTNTYTPGNSFGGDDFGRGQQQLVPCWLCHGTSYRKLIKISGLCNTCHAQQRKDRKAAAAEEERRAKTGETVDAEEKAREEARKYAQAEYEREQREKTLAQQRLYEQAQREANAQAQMRAYAEERARAQAATHARAQEAAYREQLRQQRERLERERQEKIRREHEARNRQNPRGGAQFKPPGGLGGDGMVHDLDVKWEHFSSSFKAPIKHHHIPWPGPNAPGLSRQDTVGTAKKKIRKATLRWHPDKFIAKFGDALCPIDRTKILEKVNETFHAITKSKQTLDANPTGGGQACAQM
ncbi:hypothetical protein SARC_04018 [Sphaeroforma arctica JP610]|uniref:Uncharacterized protein n=1 Tax=Sphaeroforma arctica JP610 TaxID=667725 RepID=A0A0L0G3X0_9EUKA|nr:hypothetical protein SARC_04018 [Sphaeroforma arctica JP610]KNC83740.1 hypothetical protein SARC_04018 [Sphaeroforma arctica JP610]|eukprot:XP_014157642.1 hypothetical protein SARC_04018 [Sphaeroforma arctica JP610]